MVMVGIPGAGKTHFAAKFAETFSTPFVNAGELQQITQSADEEVSKLSLHMLDELLKTKKTLIYEGPTHRKEFRQDLAKKIHKAGYKPLFVWVQTESNESLHRFLKNNRHLSADDFDATLDAFVAPDAKEAAVVISGRHTYTSQVKSILKRISTSTARPPLKPAKRNASHGRRMSL